LFGKWHIEKEMQLITGQKKPANLPDFVIHHHIQIMNHDKDYTMVELQGMAVPESSLNVLLCDNRDFSR